jgi:hypothetical protein
VTPYGPDVRDWADKLCEEGAPPCPRTFTKTTSLQVNSTHEHSALYRLLSLVTDTWTRAEIAKRLGISESGVMFCIRAHPHSFEVVGTTKSGTKDAAVYQFCGSKGRA